MPASSFFWSKHINTSPFKIHDSENKVDKLWCSSRSKLLLLPGEVSSSIEKINFSDIGPVNAAIKRTQTDVSSQQRESDNDYLYVKNFLKEDESEKSLLSYSGFPTKPYDSVNEDVIVLPVPGIVKPVHETKNALPKYISDLTCGNLQDSPPKWLCSILPKTVKDQTTVVVGGRPWHDQNVCTWSDDVRSLSPLANKKVQDRKSPMLHWNNICMSAEKTVNPLVTEIIDDSSLYNVKSNINEEEDTKYNLLKDDCEESMCILYYAGFDEVSNASIKNIPDDTLSQILERFLSSSPSYLVLDTPPNTSERQKRKMSRDKVFRPPEIRGLSSVDDAAYQIFKLNFSWPDNVVNTKKPDSKIQREEITKPLVGKYKIIRVWPYSGNLVEKFVENKNVQTEQKIPEIETVSIIINDSKSFSITTSLGTKNLDLSGSLSIDKKSKIDDKKNAPSHIECLEDQEFELLKDITPPPVIEDFIFENTETEVLKEDFKFTPYIIQQSADMKSTERHGQFAYILSDLKFLLNDVTKMPRKKTKCRIATYATKLYYETNDMFTPTSSGSSVDYKSGRKFLRIQCNGSGSVFYPNGGVAIDVKNFDPSKVVTCAVKRYVIYGGCGRTKPVLGVFDTLGNGIVYDYSGNIRLNFSQTYGVLFETKTGKPYRWQWHNVKLNPETEVKVTDAKENLENPQNELEEMYNRGIDLFEKIYNENIEKSVEGKPMHEKEYHKSIPNKENVKTSFTQRDSSLKENGKKLSRLDKESMRTPIREHKSSGDNGTPLTSSPIKTTPDEKSKPNKDHKYSLQALKPFQLYINKWIKLQIFDQCHISIQFKMKEKSLRLEIGIIIDPKQIVFIDKISDKLAMKQDFVCHFDKFPGRANSLINLLDNVDNGCRIQTAFTNILPDEGFPDNLPYKYTPVVFSEEPLNGISEALNDQCITETETVKDDVQPIRWKKEKKRVFENIHKMKIIDKPFDEIKEEKVVEKGKKDEEPHKALTKSKQEDTTVHEKVIQTVEGEPSGPLEGVIGNKKNIVADIRALMELETPITNILTPKEQIFYKFCQDNIKLNN